MLFRIKPGAASHVEGHGKDMVTYKAGDIFECVKELDKKFPNKFERLVDIQPVVPMPVKTSVPTQTVVDVPQVVMEKPVVQRGRKKGQGNVTDQFPLAEGKDVKVILKNGEYVAIDADNPSLVLDTFETVELLKAWLVDY
jgi:hypothetical protein